MATKMRRKMINTIYSIEQGKTIDPKLSTLLKLSKALRVRLGVLVGVENPMNPVVEPRNRDIYRTNKTLQNVWQCHKVCGRMMIAARAMQSLITAYYCDHSEQEYRPADTVESDRHTLIAADAVRYADALIERLNQVFDRLA
jgi:DNA-binding XRE family transcriptional regulator